MKHVIYLTENFKKDFRDFSRRMCYDLYMDEDGRKQTGVI